MEITKQQLGTLMIALNASAQMFNEHQTPLTEDLVTKFENALAVCQEVAANA